ncbi:MAG: hypothetical protein AAF678_13420, partial [Pseudomonadota bacterium]
NQMRVEMQRAQAAIMMEVAAGGMSVEDANQLMASMFGASTPTTAQASTPFMEPLAAPVVGAPPPPPPTRQ